MTEGLITNMESLGMISEGARAPPSGETSAQPRDDDVVVFRDFFVAGLRFLIDPVLVRDPSPVWHVLTSIDAQLFRETKPLFLVDEDMWFPAFCRRLRLHS